MEFYFHPSACSFATNIVLEEAGLDCEITQNAESENELAHGGFTSFSSKQKYAQTLKCENGAMLTEVPVIIQMIAHLAPQANLAPQVGTLEHFKLQNWISFISNEVLIHFAPFRTPDSNKDWREDSMSRLRHSFNILETHFESNDYLMTGCRYSIADAYLFTILRMAESFKINLSEWRELSHYKEFLSKRPAIQRAMDYETLI